MISPVIRGAGRFKRRIAAEKPEGSLIDVAHLISELETQKIRHESEHSDLMTKMGKELEKIRLRANTVAKGEKGDVPIAGVHFPIPRDGKDADETAIEQRILSKIKPAQNGKDAIIDYKKVARMVLGMIPKSETGKKIDPKDIRDAIAQLPEDQRISPEHITGLETYIKKFWDRYPRGYLHGAGITKVIAGAGISVSKDGNGNPIITATGAGFSVITVSGTINDVNVSFTAPSQPTLLDINGAFYKQSGGAITWTYVAGNITLSSPVGSGGSIFGV